MKKSNFFILSSSLLMFGLIIGISVFSNKYVSISEFQNNQRESKNSIDTDTYNYNTVLFDKPFDEVIIRDVSQNRSANLNHLVHEIQWVKSDRTGIKKSNYGVGISSARVEQNKLIIDLSESLYSGVQLILYSPSLIKIRTENVGSSKLIDTKKDALEIDVNSGEMEIAESNLLQNLTIRAKKSNVKVSAESIGEANYLLSSNSIISSHISLCNQLSIQGDNTSTVLISPRSNVGESPLSLYKYMSYNDEMGTVVIAAATTINKIIGKKDKLTLNMSVKQIEETLQNLNVE